MKQNVFHGRDGGWCKRGRQTPPLVDANLGYCWSICFEFQPLPVWQMKYKGNTKKTQRNYRGNMKQSEGNMKEA